MLAHWLQGEPLHCSDNFRIGTLCPFTIEICALPTISDHSNTLTVLSGKHIEYYALAIAIFVVAMQLDETKFIGWQVG